MAACHRCGTAFQFSGQVSRQEACRSCHSFLRCCLNCEFYEPRNKNDCAEPEAEPVGDKEGANFCEFFQASSRQPSAARPARSPAGAGSFDSLFGKNAPSDPPAGDAFEDLFKK